MKKKIERQYQMVREVNMGTIIRVDHGPYPHISITRLDKESTTPDTVVFDDMSELPGIIQALQDAYADVKSGAYDE